MKRIQISPGDKFSAWTVVAGPVKSDSGHTQYRCRCVCGTERVVYLSNLRACSKSCGCVDGHSGRRTHGMTKLPEYRIWRGIIDRCYYPSSHSYPWYGGRGVRIHDAWRHSFEDFLGHIGRRPTRKHSVDRIDPHGHYEPGNVRWVTIDVQGKNRRSKSSSGVVGVYPSGNLWRAVIGVDGRSVELGHFDNLKTAIAARQDAEARLWPAS